MVWDKIFWNSIRIDLYKTKINFKDNDLNIFKKELKSNMTEDRFKDVIKYTKLLNKGIDLDKPLYITSKCLNLLSADMPENKIYILDGSRRLAAHTLSGYNPEILVIDIKYESSY